MLWKTDGTFRAGGGDPVTISTQKKINLNFNNVEYFMGDMVSIDDRNRIPIDEELVRSLAAIMCTNDEIAAIVGCGTSTLERRCRDALIRGREEAKASLRRAQWAKAQQGNTAMLIWLGKQYLGQKERIDYGDLTDEELLSKAREAFAKVQADESRENMIEGSVEEAEVVAPEQPEYEPHPDIIPTEEDDE